MCDGSVTSASAMYSCPLPTESRAGTFSLEIVTVWLVPSAGQKIPVEPGWYLPPHQIPLAENRFLHAGNGAENTPGRALLTAARGHVVIFL